MPSLIQRVPSALLSSLGVKSQGKNPDLLSDLTQPTLEIGDLYQLRNKVLETGSVAAGAGSGTLNTNTCPQGKVRLVHYATCQVTVGAGERTRFCIGFTNNSASGAAGATTQFNLSDWILADVADATLITMMATTDRPFWMEPGDTIMVRRNQTSAGNITYFTRLLFNEYDI